MWSKKISIMYLIFNIIIQHPLPKVDSGPGIRQISANMKLFDLHNNSMVVF